MTKFAVDCLRDVSLAACILDQEYFAWSNDPRFTIAGCDFHRRVEIDHVLPLRGRVPVIDITALRRPKDNAGSRKAPGNLATGSLGGGAQS